MEYMYIEMYKMAWTRVAASVWTQVEASVWTQVEA
jgi:hypothetical protein